VCVGNEVNLAISSDAQLLNIDANVVALLIDGTVNLFIDLALSKEFAKFVQLFNDSGN